MKKGFTLLELLIVIIIIGILALIAAPQFFRVADRAKESKAKQMLSQIGRVATTYRTVYGSFGFTLPGTIGVNMEGKTPGSGNNDIEIIVPNDDPDYSYSISGSIVTATKKGTGGHRNFSLNLDNGVIY